MASVARLSKPGSRSRIFGRITGGRHAVLGGRFFVIALIAGALGFGGLAAAAGGIAQILFYIFLVMFLVALIAGLVGRGRPPAI